ncbi:MAG: hypothetical protein ACOC34_00585 [Thermotogota bacterium]
MLKYNVESRMRVVDEKAMYIEVKSFDLEGKHYQPEKPLQFLATYEPEGWIYIRDDSVGVRDGGKTLEEALGGALLMTVDQYESLTSPDDSDGGVAEKAKKIRDRFMKWEASEEQSIYYKNKA